MSNEMRLNNRIKRVRGVPLSERLFIMSVKENQAYCNARSNNHAANKPKRRNK